MLKKLLSFHGTFIRRRTVLNEIVENANRAGRSKYFVTKCPTFSPFGGNGQNFRDFHNHGPRRKKEDRREIYASLTARDEGTDGEKGVDIDMSIKRCVHLNFTYFSLQIEVQNGYHFAYPLSLSAT
jgi:hypothetical protein